MGSGIIMLFSIELSEKGLQFTKKWKATHHIEF